MAGVDGGEVTRWRSLVDADPRDEALAWYVQALVLKDLRHFAEAAAMAWRALDQFERHAGPDDPDVLNAALLLASLRRDTPKTRRPASESAGPFDGEAVTDRLRGALPENVVSILRLPSRHNDAA